MLRCGAEGVRTRGRGDTGRGCRGGSNSRGRVVSGWGSKEALHKSACGVVEGRLEMAETKVPKGWQEREGFQESVLGDGRRI